MYDDTYMSEFLTQKYISLIFGMKIGWVFKFQINSVPALNMFLFLAMNRMPA